MASSGRAKVFFFKTIDEYSSLVATKVSDENHTFVNPNHNRSRSPETCAKSDLQNSIDAPLDFSTALECARMNLKTRFRKGLTSTISDAKRTAGEATALKSDKVFSDFLSCELTGDKVNRARQVLGKPSIVSMFRTNSSGRITYTIDTGLAVLGFLSEIQVHTKEFTV